MSKPFNPKNQNICTVSASWSEIFEIKYFRFSNTYMEYNHDYL